jgi:hypothetical protein
MKVAIFCTSSLLALCLFALPARSQGGFREVLKIVDIEPTKLTAIDTEKPTADDWQVVSQILARLDQHASDLDRWTMNDAQFAAANVGELFNLEGTTKRVDKLVAPAGFEPPQLYSCQLEFNDGRQAIVLTAQVPSRWKVDKAINEPASLRGVLLQANEAPVLLTPHLSWHPREGLPLGQLLLARFGMDAALWDDIVQRTAFISPERGREAQVFYAVLETIAKVPPADLAALTLQSIADGAIAVKTETGTKQERLIAAAVAERAAVGLSSVVPLFLNPQEQVGHLVRLEGTARRAVRIVVDGSTQKQSLAEYYELDVFTADSQNLPIVCLVPQLPAGFPVGDTIHAGVRLDGVFFKLWRYHTRKTAQTEGETAPQQASYTPVVMAATVTWLKQATTPKSWWGLAVGGVIFVLVIGGLLRMSLASRTRPQIHKETPDFSKL